MYPIGAFVCPGGRLGWSRASSDDAHDTYKRQQGSSVEETEVVWRSSVATAGERIGSVDTSATSKQLHCGVIIACVAAFAGAALLHRGRLLRV